MQTPNFIILMFISGTVRLKRVCKMNRSISKFLIPSQGGLCGFVGPISTVHEKRPARF